MSRISNIKKRNKERRKHKTSNKVKHAMRMLAHPKPVSKDDAILTPKRLATVKRERES